MEKENVERHFQNVGTDRIKIMSLISRFSLAINAFRGEIFVGSFHYSRGFSRQM